MQLLSIKQVAMRTTLAEQTIRNWVCMGKFPRPMKLGGRSVWDEEDLNSWLFTLKQESKNETQ